VDAGGLNRRERLRLSSQRAVLRGRLVVLVLELAATARLLLLVARRLRAARAPHAEPPAR
jgi:hypothetical protein